jgi:hypothetical protein
LIWRSGYPLCIRIVVWEAIAESDLAIHSLYASRIGQFRGGCGRLMLHPKGHAQAGDERKHYCHNRQVRPYFDPVHNNSPSLNPIDCFLQEYCRKNHARAPEKHERFQRETG